MEEEEEDISEKILYSAPGIKSCPVDITFRIIAKKFTVLLIRNMLSNQTRFNQFLSSIEGINQKLLSARLKEMEEGGLITRKVLVGSPIGVEYRLTEKGIATKPILDQMASYSLQYCPKDLFDDGKPRSLHQVIL